MEISVNIIKATPEHAPHLMQMIRDLAAFEKMEECVTNTTEKLKADMENDKVQGYIAFDGEKVAGALIFFAAYSVWVGKHYILEDIFVYPEYRRLKLARKLWQASAQQARDEGMLRLRWQSLEWNKSAHRMYDTVEHVNLTKNEGWNCFAISEKEIKKLAEEQ